MQIEEQIKDFISTNLLHTAREFPYANDTSFLQEGLVDSVGMMELVEFVQKNFKLTVELEEVTPGHFDSVTKMASFIRGKLNIPEETEGSHSAGGG